jgi:hypothetical protein
MLFRQMLPHHAHLYQIRLMPGINFFTISQNPTHVEWGPPLLPLPGSKNGAVAEAEWMTHLFKTILIRQTGFVKPNEQRMIKIVLVRWMHGRFPPESHCLNISSMTGVLSLSV